MNKPLFNMVYRNYRLTLIILGVSIILTELMVHWFIASSALAKIPTQFMQMLPQQFRIFFDFDGTGVLSPLNIISIGYTHPFVVLMFAFFPASLCIREITGARDTGIIELTLSRPLSRFRYIATLEIFLILGLIFLGLSITAGSALSLVLFKLDYIVSIFIPVILNLLCLSFLLGNLFFLVSVSSKSHHRAVGVITGITLGFYILEYMGKAIKTINPALIINPFHYYQPGEILNRGNFPLTDMVILIVAGVVIFTVAVSVFRRSDL